MRENETMAGNGHRGRRAPLRFSRLRLQNYKNFKHADVTLRDRAFLVGPNASGKSNLLDAFRFLGDIARKRGGGLQAAVEDRGGLSSVRSLHATRNTVLGIDVDVASVTDDPSSARWRYKLEVAGQKGEVYVFAERVERNGRLIKELTSQTAPRSSQTLLEQEFSNADFRELVDFFRGVTYLHLVPQFIRNPDRLSRTTPFDPFGSDFMERVVKTNPSTQKANLTRIQRALRLAVPQLEELKVEQDRMGVPHLKGRYKHWRKSGAFHDETQFSDGTLRLIGLFWSLLDGTGPLLLEEPELSLHPAIVGQLPTLMASVMVRRQRQIIVSTHAPDMLRDESIAADELIVLYPGDHGSVVQTGSDFEDLRVLMEEGLTADTALSMVAPPDAARLSELEPRS
jgi:predicted ATPase